MRLWLVEPSDSPFAARIERASAEAGLTVGRLDAIETAPASAQLIGVGPSAADPLRIARHLRSSGAHALLVFFVASTAARDGLQAELVRDPFVYPRYWIIDVPTSSHQFASRLAKVVAELKQRTQAGRTSQRGRRRTRASVVPAHAASAGEPLLAHVLTQTRDAVLSTDEAGRIVAWNAAAGQLFGLKGRGRISLTHLSHQPDLVELIQLALRTGTTQEAPITCGADGDRPIQIVASAAPLRDASDGLLGISVVARDDSDYQRMQEALREANRQKDEFLAIMSHELRTPLTSLLGYTDMVLRGLSGPLAPLTTRYVGNVRSAADRLLDLVNSLLDYTRLEAGVERLELRRVDLGRIVRQAVQLCQSTAQSKQLDLHLAIEHNLDASVEADEECMTHVFRSMLGNALKFTPAGGWIQVNVQPERDAANGVRVSISDSGIGLQPEQIGRVWERFYQGDASLTRPYGGIGLGLSIARHVVSLHGGRVGAESGGPGRGSTFWFSIPKRQRS